MQSPQETHHPSSSPPKRPKGILKNRSSSNANATSPEHQPTRPPTGRELSEREIVVANTLHNSGLPPNRRSSSAVRGTNSRRQSTGYDADEEENSPRLKWDEANLYLTEQQRDSTMKITEPKTPYAKQYDPATDADEMVTLDAEGLIVDEVDAKRQGSQRLDEIPGLDLGEPEMDTQQVATPESEKRVMVDPDSTEDDEGHHGEDLGNLSEEERAKHRRFEEMRRRHYEMKDVKNLLRYVSFCYSAILMKHMLMITQSSRV
jgi:protein phosphatase inhibitor 2